MYYSSRQETEALVRIVSELVQLSKTSSESLTKALATVTRGTLMKLGASPRSASAVGIEDVVEA